MNSNPLKFGTKILYHLALYAIIFNFLVYPVYASIALFPYGMNPINHFYFERNSNQEQRANKDDFEEKEPISTLNKRTFKNKIISNKGTESSNFDKSVIHIDVLDKAGIIGYNNKSNSDDPADNIFSFSVDKSVLKDKIVTLSYDVFGVENASGIARSINENPSFGGYIAKMTDKWHKVEEVLSFDDLKNGTNTILFTASEKRKLGYEIKNLKIEAINNTEDELIKFSDGFNMFSKNDIGYLKGTILKNNLKLFVNNEKVNLINNVFEVFVGGASGTIELRDNLDVVKYSKPINSFFVKEATHVLNYEPINKLYAIEKWETNVSGFNLEEVTLKIKNESYKHIDKITVQKLRTVDVTPLGTNILNVTVDKAAFRFLPDGAKFNDTAKIGVKYDKNLIPKGYTPEDIRLMYFDLEKRRWLTVPTDTILMDASKIVGNTNHFTDYIAGVIQTPESPETNSFAPTTISGIQVANPTTNITQIAPPTANQKGDGNVDFPIVVPAGRNGLQPNLSVSYNNNGASGIVGYGWDIAIPFISVDTKFGVPEYNSLKETESYLLNGEELLLKNGNDLYLPHRSGNTINRVTGAVFYPKVETSFSKIQRLGDNPTNYSWIVWDKSGTKYYYGNSTNSKLSAANGNIAKWMLQKVEDKNGNFMTYRYTLKNYSEGNTVNGKEVILGSITYTDNVNLSATNKHLYRINFTYNAENRLDLNLNFRYGFKEVNGSSLQKISVFSQKELEYDNEPVLRDQYQIDYIFNYDIGKFGKQLLKSIETVNIKRELGTDNIEDTQAYTHTFEYHDDIQYGLFGPENVIEVPKDTDKKLSVLGGTIEKNEITGDVDFGVGIFSPIFPSSYIPISYSGTANFSIPIPNSVTSEPMMSLMDIDGDGLPDKVVKKGSSFKYRRNIGANQFSNYLYDINHFSEISSVKTRTSSKISPSFSMMILNKAFSNSRSVSESNIFLTDANADGLIDYVKDKIVYFNRLDPTTKLPTFTDNSELTPNRIFKEGDVDASVLAPLPDLNLENDLMDVVKVWIAPKDGTININGVISKPFGGSEHGIKYSIEKSSSFINLSPFNLNNDYVLLDMYPTSYIKNPTLLIVNSISTNHNNISVKKGDQIYFRVNASQPPYNQIKVNWDPSIDYTTEDFNSPNNFKQYSSKFSDAFIYGDAHAEPIIFSESGNFRLAWDAFTINNANTVSELSDEVTIKATLYKASENTPEDVQQIYTYQIKKDILNNMSAQNFMLNVSGVNADDPSTFRYLKIEILTDSQINWKVLDDRFKPRVVNAATGAVNFVKPFYKVYSDQQTKFYGSYFNQNTTVTVKHNFALNNCGNNCTDQYIYLVVKNQNGKLVNATNNSVAKFRYKIDANGNVTEVRQYTNFDYSIVLYPTTTTQINALAGNTLYFEYYTETRSLARLLTNYQTDYNNLLWSNVTGAPKTDYNATGTNVGLFKANIFAVRNLTGFGTLYRNWGQFAYKGAKPNEEFSKIKRIYLGKTTLAGLSSEEPTQADLTAQENNFQNLDVENLEYNFEDETFNNTTGAVPNINQNQINAIKHFTMLKPDRASSSWKAHTRLYVKASEMSPYFRYDIGQEMQQLNIPPPTSLSSFGAVSIVRQSISQSTGDSFGVGFGPLGFGNSKSKAETIVLNDYQDVNGDGYPDIIGNNVQLTSFRGGLSSKTWNDQLLFKNNTNGEGKSISGGKTTTLVNILNKQADIRIGNQSSANASIGANGMVTYTAPEGSLLDINGDGLADKVLQNGSVMFNTGNGFIASTFNGFDKVSESRTQLTGIGGSVGSEVTNLSENYDASNSAGALDGYKGSSNIDFSVGMSGSRSATTVTRDFMDINGDGLLDYVKNNSVYFNTGTGFSNSNLYLPKPTEFNNAQIGLSFNLSISFLIPFGIFPIGLKLGAGGGINSSNNYSDDVTKYTDFDGDGFVDMLHSTNEGELVVRYSNVKRTNMLKKINNPTGSTIELDYASKNIITNTVFGNNYKMPFKKWVLAKVTVTDGFNGDGENESVSAFEYFNGYKDRSERKFIGFGEVKTYQLNKTGAIYRTVSQEYLLNDLKENELYLPGHASDLRKYNYIGNLLKKESVYDAYNRLINTTENEYVFHSLGGNFTSGLYTWSQPNFTYTYMSRIAPVVKRNKSVVRSYQGNSTSSYIEDVNSTFFEMYDYFGNPLSIQDEVDGNNILINYHHIDDGVRFVTNVPANHYVNNNLRHSTTEVDNKGNIIKIEKVDLLTGTFATSSTNLEYDSLGNLVKVTQPKPSSGSPESQRMYYSYIYDTIFHTFVTQVSDAYGYKSHTNYTNFGMPVVTSDLNGVEIYYDYDGMRRPILVKGPYNDKWTIRNSYGIEENKGIRYALTAHNLTDEAIGGPEVVLKTSSFADGLGRIVQTKKQLDTNDLCGNQGYRTSVSGKINYDEFGRVKESYLGQEAFDCGGDLEVFLKTYSQTTHDVTEKTSIDYDSQDRVVQQHVHGLNATTSNYYGFDTDYFGANRSFEKVVLPEGNVSITYKDHKGRVTTTKQVNTDTSEELPTAYQYNTIGELTEVIDAQDLVTSYEYDGFGQKIRSIHPDAGTNEFTYDLTGKLIKTANQNLLNNGQQISYKYHFNQLQVISYPSHSVSYEYGPIGAPNYGVGRITRINDLTGVKIFKYGAIGEVLEENRKINTQNGSLYFTDKYRFDSWGRVLNMTYADGEVLTYQYNNVGQLMRIVNDKDEEYLTNVKYNYFDQPTEIVYGNGVVTKNEYDITQRIRAMQLNRPDQSTFMRNVYSYDRNQNITNITNDYSQHHILKLGGTSHKNYEYDKFNRLLKANGNFAGYDENHDFSLNMKYNRTHGISEKSQNHNYNINGNSGVSEHNYNGTYNYDNGDHPHAVSSIEYNTGNAKFDYDANGNMLRYIKAVPDSPFVRDFKWDEQNRLLAVIDNDEKVSHYVYDHAGERTFKSHGYIDQLSIAGANIYQVLNMYEYIIYPSGNLVVNPEKNEYSKHYYINGKRFMSRIEMETKSFYEPLPGNDGFKAKQVEDENPNQTPNVNEVVEIENITYFLPVGNDENNCYQQIQTIRSNFVNNNNPPTQSLQHCIDKIDQILAAGGTYCDALQEIHNYICEPLDVNVPVQPTDPGYTIEHQLQLDCLNDLNVLIGEYTEIAIANGFTISSLLGRMSFLNSLPCDENITYDCCKRYLISNVWDCPDCPEMGPENCNPDGTINPNPGGNPCTEEIKLSCCELFEQTGVWDCIECDEMTKYDCPNYGGNPPGEPECDENMHYDCCKRYQIYGYWDCDICPDFNPSDCGPITGEPTTPGTGGENYNEYVRCVIKALDYIETNLVFEPELNACEVLEYVRENYKCVIKGGPDKDPVRPGETEDEWEDEGGGSTETEDGKDDDEMRKPIWWYHTDHLGSSTYLTDNFGRPSHYYETLPFGEMIVEHNQSANNPTNAGYNNAYKFNGKELDDATGMYYYGARYYDPRISIFVSVDPLAEKAPNWTPYRYAFNNPIMFTDPTGLFETKLGAWWHKQWNGNDSSSDIRFDDKRKEYFYTNHSSYVDDDGNEGLSMDFIYNSQKGDAGKFVFEAEGKASVGLQLGLKGSLWGISGRAEGGLITGDIGKVGWSNQEEDNYGFYSEWGDGKGHNFGSIGFSFLDKKAGAGVSVDYITPHITPPGGDIIDYYSNNGEATGGFSLGPNSRHFWKPKSGTMLDDLGTAVRLRGKTNGVNNHTVDLSIGAKAILGIEGKVRIGFTGKK